MSIRLSFHGAAGDVTGSAYLIETSQARILIDFGMFQGGRKMEEMNVLPPALNPAKLNAVLVTHAHLDHTGRLPLLVKAGFRGPAFATEPTIELTGLILRDSAFIQEQDIKRTNRKRQRAGESFLEPIYNAQDVEKFLGVMRAVDYGKFVDVAPGIQARYVEAGHILGSASIQLKVQDGGRTRTMVFSGDIGQSAVPILNDPIGFESAELVVMESTYGDRDHKSLKDTEAEFEEIVKAVYRQGGKMLVPVFAVGRTQLILYLLTEMFCDGTVKEFPIYVDSPMAIEATKIYRNHLELFDEEFHQLRRCRPILEATKSFIPTPTAKDSMKLNSEKGPCLIMAGSGMCTGGRILHHLKENLWRPEAHVIIVGFQSYGSLGRMIVDRKETVKIFGEQIAVRANVHTLGGFSAHAGQSGLMKWFEPLAKCKPRVFLTHGEDRGRDPLAALIEKTYGLKSEKPLLGDVFECRTGAVSKPERCS